MTTPSSRPPRHSPRHSSRQSSRHSSRHSVVERLSGLRDELYQIARSFARRPGLVLVAVVSLALGIGANAALFSVADAVLFAEMPYADDQRVVRAWESFQAPGGERWTGTVSYPNLLDWRERSGFALGAYQIGSVNLTSSGAPERVRAAMVDEEVFEILGVDAVRGRTFGVDDVAGDGRVVVLSDSVWRTRYGADPDLVGGTIDLGGAAHVVLGIMPPSFEFPPRPGAALWLPLQLDAEQKEKRGWHSLHVVGRVPTVGAPSDDIERAQTALETIAAQIAVEHPEQQEHRSVSLLSVHEATVGDARPVLYALWGAVGLVLLIACGNVAHLLLARGARREQEMVVRAALGAGRGRLALRVLLEALLLAGLGGVLGLALGRGALSLVELPSTVAAAEPSVALDLRIVAYCFVAALVAALFAGALPAWKAARVSFRGGPRSSRGGVGRRHGRRGVLVVAEVALALVVIVGAVLMVRSLLELTRVDTGLDAENVMTVRIPMPDDREDEAIRAAYRRIEDSVAALPSVESAGMISLLPLQAWGWNGRVAVEGRPQLPEGEIPWVEFRVASGDYFETLGIDLRSGRTFGPTDDGEGPMIAIVNESLARAYWGDDDPLGGRLGFGRDAAVVDEWWTVVGVVADVRNVGLERETRPEVYIPPSQLPLPEMSLVARARGDVEALAAEIRGAVLAVDPLQPVYDVKTMEQVVHDHTSDRRFETALLAAFAALALVLALVGVYSVMSHDVSRRRSEVGLRMALGSDRAAVARLFLAQSTRQALLGAALGIALALAAARLLASRLYGIEAHDPATLVGGAAALVAVTALASLVPALRAASIQPTKALRDE